MSWLFGCDQALIAHPFASRHASGHDLQRLRKKSIGQATLDASDDLQLALDVAGNGSVLVVTHPAKADPRLAGNRPELRRGAPAEAILQSGHPGRDE
jgi:hypothetical protein